jgi:DivIVA domain-containing protein
MSDDRHTTIWTSAADLVPGMPSTEVRPELEILPAPAGDADQLSVTESPEPGASAPPFDLTLRGYDRHQVDDYLLRVEAAFAQLGASLDQSVARESAVAAELAVVRAELDRGRPTFDALGERVSQMLGLAESEADQMRADALREAEKVREQAGLDAAQLRSDARRDADELGAVARAGVAELERRRGEMLSQITGIRDTLDSILGRSQGWPATANHDTLPAVTLDE